MKYNNEMLGQIITMNTIILIISFLLSSVKKIK